MQKRQVTITGVLLDLANAGHQIMSCNFADGIISFRVVSQPEDSFAENEVLSLLRKSPMKIPAIKLCRELTGMGLADAKRFVENIMAKHGIEAVYPPRT